MQYPILGRLSPILSHRLPDILQFGQVMNVAQFTKWHWIGWLALVLLTFTPQTIAHDTSHTITRLVVHQTPDTFELWNLNADETLRFIADLTAYPKPKVTIDVSPSPDGQHVAYTALLNGDTPLLVLVSFNPLKIEQFAAPGISSLQWSPSSNALLLSRPSIYLSGASYILSKGDSYVFDVDQKTFTLIAETKGSQIIRQIKWIPSGNGIIYNAEVSADFGNLYIMKHDSTNRKQLTHLETEAPQTISFTQPGPRSSCYLKNFKWSLGNARWYSILTCNSVSDLSVISSLFSTDMNGNNRLETDLYEQFPEEYDPITISGYQVVDFFPAVENVYLVVNSPKYDLLIIDIKAPNQAEIVGLIPSSDGIFAAISPDHTHIAISRQSEGTSIFNVRNKQFQTVLPTYSERVACRVQWVDNETLLIDQVGSCGTANSSFFYVEQTIALNIQTGTTFDVTASLDGTNLIIPLPEASNGV